MLPLTILIPKEPLQFVNHWSPKTKNLFSKILMESSVLLFCSLAAIPSGQGGGSPAAMAGSSLLQFPVPVGREELRSGQGCFRR